MTNPSHSPWSPWQRRLHWFLALLLLVMLSLGFYSSTLLLSDPNKLLVLGVHQGLGCFVLLVGLVRLRARRPIQMMNYPDSMSRVQRRVARGVQAILYLLPIVLPLLGMMLTWLDPFLWPNTARGGNISDTQANGADLIHGLHYFGAWLLVLLISVHAIAGLSHLLGAKGKFWRQRIRW